MCILVYGEDLVARSIDVGCRRAVSADFVDDINFLDIIPERPLTAHIITG